MKWLFPAAWPSGIFNERWNWTFLRDKRLSVPTDWSGPRHPKLIRLMTPTEAATSFPQLWFNNELRGDQCLDHKLFVSQNRMFQTLCVFPGGEAIRAGQASFPQHTQEADSLSAGTAGCGRGQEVCQVALREFSLCSFFFFFFKLKISLSYLIPSFQFDSPAVSACFCAEKTPSHNTRTMHGGRGRRARGRVSAGVRVPRHSRRRPHSVSSYCAGFFFLDFTLKRLLIVAGRCWSSAARRRRDSLRSSSPSSSSSRRTWSTRYLISPR